MGVPCGLLGFETKVIARGTSADPRKTLVRDSNCRSGSMTISDGAKTKILTLYPPARPRLETKTQLWMELEEEEGVQPLLMIWKSLTLKDETEDDTINSFIGDPTSINKHVYQILNSTFGEEEKENLTEDTLVNDSNIIPVLKN